MTSSTSTLFIVYYSWTNTAKNHAGMAYLVNKLKDEFPRQIRLIEIPNRINSWHRMLQRLYFYYSIWVLKLQLRKSDKVLFMEYLGNRSGNQTGIAMKLRNLGIKNEFTGLVHLPGNSLMEIYNDKQFIINAVNSVDKILTFGSSLTGFFAGFGFGEKTLTTFHYIDTDYYKPSSVLMSSDSLQVIHIGSLKRNFNRLKEIVKLSPEIQFHICQGNNDLSNLFAGEDNVELYGFLDEKELLRLMQACQVSLSILEDTVGSNVITTSLACGLVNVVSDVGSIRDYCTEDDSIFCQSDNDFADAIQKLNEDRDFLTQLRKNALSNSTEFALHKFKAEFEDIFLK